MVLYFESRGGEAKELFEENVERGEQLRMRRRRVSSSRGASYYTRGHSTGVCSTAESEIPLSRLLELKHFEDKGMMSG